VNRRDFVFGSIALTAPVRPLESFVLIGDSHAYMMARAFRDVARAYDKRVAVVAHGGSSVRQWLVKKWVQREVLAKYPDATTLLISLGTNCTRVERPRLVDDIKNLVLQGGRSTYWLLPPPMKMDTTYLRDAVAHWTGVFPIDPGPLPMMPDGIHVTQRGRYMWAQKIADVAWS
jgi:hypothetical protein